MAHPLAVPVREKAGSISLQVFSTPAGERAVAAFSTEERLRRVLGPRQGYVLLAEPVLRRLTEDADVARLVVDPTGCAPLPRRPWR
ncbi:SAV_915 family protein [Spongiactinospora sp. 9N601]|uniref:SAV_915 family protein n=1 Tax=Spongiactinospora sp. 9N601 TaxID=3375149 RepID=UPI0037CCA58F